MRRFLLILLALPVLAAAGWSAWWWHSAGRLEDGFRQWAEARRAEGYEVEFGGLSVGGFPGRLAVRMEAPVVAGADRGALYRWRGAPTEVVFRPWDLRRAVILAPGRHEIAHSFGALASPLVLTARQADGAVDLGGTGTPDSYHLRLADVTVEAGKGRAEAGRITADLFLPWAPESGESGKAFDLLVAVDRLVLPGAQEGALGRTIERASTDMTLNGAIPPGPAPEAVAAWRDAGGTAEMRSLMLAWGPLLLDGSGTLTLDGEMRPLGAFTTRIRGYEEVLDALAAEGTLGRTQAEAAKFALGLIARTPADGRRPELSVPLTAQDGWLSVGPISLIPLSPIPLE